MTQSFQVAPASLTITAQPATRAFGQPNPAFSFVASGFVSADTPAVLSGGPTYTTTADPASPPGSYPLIISQGTLFAANYTFTFVNSTLTVGKASQTITFPPLADQVFGGAAVTLQATTSSGLPVQYAATGPVTLNGNILSGFTGIGVVTVTATQSGNDSYQPAMAVTQSFNVVKATLLVLANNFTRCSH